MGTGIFIGLSDLDIQPCWYSASLDPVLFLLKSSHCKCLLLEAHSDPSTFSSSEVIRQVSASFPCTSISSSNLVASIYTGRTPIPGNLEDAI